ncbi:MMPL family transporter [Undibacterium arcticum]|uniref:MMPL family transporter n=1 Tax=Undibacterium arcticum TaxID=1762892 RepID=UPI0036169768
MAVLLLAHNAYLWFGQKIVPDSDILALLPVEERDPVLQQSFSHMVDSAQQRVIVLVGADDWTQAKRAADAYSAVLAQRGDLLQLPPPMTEQAQNDWLAPFQQHRPALLTPAQQDALQHQPKQYWVDTALGQLYSPFAGPKLGAWQDDPFGLFSGWVQARAQETPVRPRDERLFVENNGRQYVLLPLTLKVPAFSMTAQRSVLPLLERAAQAARQAVPQVELVSAGVVLHAAAASTQASGEMSTIGLGSLAGIVLLVWLTFRSVKPILLIALSLGIGCLGAWSLCWLVFGRVHLLTLVFGASLIGVAQDYGIYFMCSRLGADRALSSAQLLRRLWPGLLLTLAAAVIGYMGLALTPFPGLRQMALFSALGLLFAWLTVICWFPFLLQPDSLHGTRAAERYGASLVRWPLLHWNRTTLVLALLFVALAGFGLARLGVNDDIRSLQSPPKALLADQIKVGKLLDAPTPVQFYLVRGASAEIVLQREEALKQRLDPLIAKHLISGYQALSNWVPSQQAQAANRAAVGHNLLADDGPLGLLAQRIGEDSDWSATMRKRLLTSAAPLTPADFLQLPASEPWRHLWLGQVTGIDGNPYASIVALRGLNDYAGLPQLKQAAQGMDGVQWVDKVGEISSVLGRYRLYMGWVLLGAYAAIFALLSIRYRAAAWRIMAPPLLASMATLALLGWTGQPLQLFHVLALMLILGLGVDYGIFLYEQIDRRDRFAWLTVGLSAINALLSFGLLSLSKTPPLHAFGLTMLIGTALVWLIVPCLAASSSSRGGGYAKIALPTVVNHCFL